MDEDLKKRIGEEAYRVTQESGTEAPFTGKYYKNKEDGIYKCIVCGNDLFDSETKFDSYSGWPSFFKSMPGNKIKYIEDKSLGMVRTEVRCARCDAHLGHVFDDGLDVPTGKRYCINSCSLDFENKEKEV